MRFHKKGTRLFDCRVPLKHKSSGTLDKVRNVVKAECGLWVSEDSCNDDPSCPDCMRIVKAIRDQEGGNKYAKVSA